MRFEEAYAGWNAERLTQDEAARLLGVCERSFRRYVVRFEADGLEGLIDRRLEQVSNRRAPVDEVMALTEQYRGRHAGWNVKHFHSWYKREGGTRSYTWVKRRLQEGKLVPKVEKRGVHRKRREPAPLPGMMVHQDGSTHEWVVGEVWDLIVTMDDATNEHYAMAFVEEEGTASSFQGVEQVIERRGLFSSFYSDRGSHYWRTPEAGGKVDKEHPTQFGRAMEQLGIEMIAAYSPEARGLVRNGPLVPTRGACRRSLSLPASRRWRRPTVTSQRCICRRSTPSSCTPAREEGSAFVPWIGGNLADTLCEQFERTVGNDNCVRFESLSLQLPAAQHRCHFVKAKVRVHRYGNGNLAVFHGPRRLADYTHEGKLITNDLKQAA